MKITCQKIEELDGCKTDQGFSVKGMLLGESATIDAKKMFITEKEVINPSPHRIKPVCPIFDVCGGCDLLHISYQYQLEMKNEYVRKMFDHSNLYSTVDPMIGSDQPLYYRHKVVLSATTRKKQLRLGLYRENSKDIIPFIDCYIHHQKTHEIMHTIEDLMNQYKIPAYDYQTNTGILKHVLIRISKETEKMLIVFVTNGYVLPNAKKMIQTIVKKYRDVETVVQNIHQKKTHLVLLEKDKVLYGKGYIIDSIEGISFRISSQSFYQVNPAQMLKLYKKAIELADIKSSDIVLDTYSGIGTIALFAAKYARKVIGVDSNASAIKDARQNMLFNHITNVDFVLDDATIFMTNYQGKVDLLMMDPTRDGSTKAFVDAAKLLKPKRIVYISCEPKTQSRDLAWFKDSYDIKHIQPVDMFSQTKHVETITLLSLK